MTTMTEKGLVLVEFEYEYTGCDGSLVSIKPNERYSLLSKTNDHWWYVCKDDHSKPFYIPAKYVKELPLHLPSPLDFMRPIGPEPVEERDEKRATDLPGEQHAVTIRLHSPRNKKAENRMSTFGIPLDIHNQDYRRGGLPDSMLTLHSQEHFTTSTSAKNISQDATRPAPSLLFDYQSSPEERQNFTLRPRVPSFGPTDPLKRLTKAKPVEQVVIKNIMATPQVQESAEKPNVAEDLEEPPCLQAQQPCNTDNIYESIVDVGLQSKESAGSGTVPIPIPGQASPPPPTPTHSVSQAENDISSKSVSASINEPSNNVPQAPMTSSSNSYKTIQATWVSASSPMEQGLIIPNVPSTLATYSPISTATNSKLEPDDTIGQHNFYNPATGGTVQPIKIEETLASPRPQDDVPPPLPEEDYPADIQDAWEPSLLVFPEDFQPSIPRASLDMNALTGWRHAPDPYGKPAFSDQSKHNQLLFPSTQPKMGFITEAGVSVMKNWRHSISPSHFSNTQGDFSFSPSHRQNSSDTGDVFTSAGPSDTYHHGLEKAGIVNKTKICDNGKKMRKSWSPSWTVLHGGVLTFHKDPKSIPAGTTNQIMPEYSVELRRATIGWAGKDKSSKKNVLELKTRHGSEYLIQYDADTIILDWYNSIGDTIRHLGSEDPSDEEEDEQGDKVSGHTDRDDRDRKKDATKQSTSGSSTETEQRRVRKKLRRFLQKRPTLQSIKDKGYIKETVFGCPLETLCSRENSTVPSFVDKCIKSVEKRGLDTDGIYRVSGNLAVIQKLRYKVDHEENLDLDDGQWEEIHVIAGALKLFFRELPEPLFPFSHFSRFIAAIKLSSFTLKMSSISELVNSLSQANRDTMKVLFRHLHKVVQFREKNRMSAQSVAIVFGPTLLRPETETANITTYMLFQTQLVEFMLNNTEKIFH